MYESLHYVNMFFPTTHIPRHLKLSRYICAWWEGGMQCINQTHRATSSASLNTGQLGKTVGFRYFSFCMYKIWGDDVNNSYHRTNYHHKSFLLTKTSNAMWLFISNENEREYEPLSHYSHKWYDCANFLSLVLLYCILRMQLITIHQMSLKFINVQNSTFINALFVSYLPYGCSYMFIHLFTAAAGRAAREGWRRVETEVQPSH